MKTIEDKFTQLLSDYRRQIEENVLFDVLCRFRFADWTRACDYQNMTSEQIVEAAMSVCDDIEKSWNYSLDDDIMPCCSTTWDFESDIL